MTTQPEPSREIDDLMKRLGLVPDTTEPKKRSRYRSQDCQCCGAERFAREYHGVLLCPKCRQIGEGSNWDLARLARFMEVLRK